MTFIPISALLGDNVVERSEKMPWYQGPPLLYHLEHVHIASDRNLIDVRFPVQWVIRPPASSVADYRAYAGQVAGGVMRAGRRGRRAARRAAHDDRRHRHLRRAGRGGVPADVGGAAAGRRHRRRARLDDRAHAQPADRLEPLRGAARAGCPSSRSTRRRRYLVKHTTRTAMVGGLDVRYRIDVETLHRDEQRRRRSSSTTSGACTSS